MKIKEYLEKMISEKRAKFDELQKKSDASEDLTEVRALGETLVALKKEIEDAETQLEELSDDDKKDPNKEDPNAEENKSDDQRGFNPLAAFNLENRGANMENEKRAKEFAVSGKTNIVAKEARSILLATGSLAKPTGAEGINDALNVVSSIVDQVKISDSTGMRLNQVAYQKSIQSATIGADGVAVAESDPVFRYSEIKPVIVKTLTYVSEEIKKQTPLQYEEKVREGAMLALRKKVGNMILSGNGTTEIYGIINAVNTEETPEAIYETLTLDSATIGADTLRKIVFSYGGDENVGGGARLFLNKNDLIAFGDVRGSNEKMAVYEITPDGANPNTGIIKDGGLSVPYTIVSGATALSDSTKGSTPIKTMVYGAPTNYELDLFGDYEVKVSEDYKFAEGFLTVRGEVMCGGNVTVDKGFVVVALATA